MFTIHVHNSDLFRNLYVGANGCNDAISNNDRTVIDSFTRSGVDRCIGQCPGTGWISVEFFGRPGLGKQKREYPQIHNKFAFHNTPQKLGPRKCVALIFFVIILLIRGEIRSTISKIIVNKLL